jgi:hypothetical protein
VFNNLKKKTIMKTKFMFAFAFAALLASCSHDETVDNPVNGKTPLNISLASVSAITRGAYEAGGVLGAGSIGVFTTGTGYSAVNMQYNYGTSSWLPFNAANTVYLSNETATVFAYGPYDAAFNRAAAPLAAGEYTEAKDLCTTTVGGFDNTHSTASLTLNHAYSRISFAINKDASYTGTCKIENIAISGPAIYTAATADFSAATTVLSGKTAGTVQYNPAIASMAVGTPVTKSFIMIPAATAEFTAATTLTFKVDGVNLTATLPAVLPASTGINELLAGSNYTVNIRIKGTKLIINSVQINPWTAVPVTGDVVPVTTPV